MVKQPPKSAEVQNQEHNRLHLAAYDMDLLGQEIALYKSVVCRLLCTFCTGENSHHEDL